MARIRSIKPDFWQNEELSSVSESAMLLSIALLNYADDEGYFNANHMLVKAACFPLRDPSKSIEECLIELCRIEYCRLGISENGKKYGHIIKFLDHQKVPHPVDSKIKNLNITWHDYNIPHENYSTPHEKYDTTTEVLPPDLNRSDLNRIGIGVEGEGSMREGGVIAENSQNLSTTEKQKPQNTRGARLPKDYIPPDEWFVFCKQTRPELNPNHVYERFRDYWIAKPGKDGVKLDWFATWRNWVRHEARAGPGKRNDIEERNKRWREENLTAVSEVIESARF